MALAKASLAAPEPDATLERARAGNMEAFGDLVRQHQRMVFGLALNVVRDRPAAEDVAQEVFLQLHRGLAGISSAAHLLFWLRRVTAHRAIDATRRDRRRAHGDPEEVPELVVVRHDGDPLLVRTLRRLVAALPPAPRAVVTLRYQEDLDPAEIAMMLDMPVNTVKSHLRRSLAVLRARAARALGGKENGR